jgi:hypothetical protein
MCLIDEKEILRIANTTDDETLAEYTKIFLEAMGARGWEIRTDYLSLGYPSFATFVSTKTL